MNKTKKYWNSLEHYHEDKNFMDSAKNEFPEQIPVDEFIGKQKENPNQTSRRDFLKFLGFSVTAATLAACETPIIKSIPYVVKPEEIVPGVANYYASTFFDGFDYCSVLVKTREGRPILIEGNPQSPITKGSVTARVNSSVLSLYDTKRFAGPQIDGEQVSWDDIDAEIQNSLNGLALQGAEVRLLSSTIISPSTQKAINLLGEKFTNAEGKSTFKHVTFDSVSSSAIIEAHLADFGKALIPNYRFDKAKIIVSVSADFLNSWMIAAATHDDYSKNRVPSKKGGMSKHYQFETGLSLTGSNADIRGAVKPSQLAFVLTELYNQLATKAGVATVSSKSIDDDNDVTAKISQAATDLWNNKANSLVVCGLNDVAAQKVVNAINQLLNNYGSTLELNNPIHTRKAIDSEVINLVNEMKQGKIAALLVMGADPAYALPSSLGFEEAINKVSLKVSFANRPDYTSSLCNYVCPDSHFLESWNDANPVGNYYSLQQPTINTLYDTRQAQSSLLKWATGNADYYAFIKDTWNKDIFSQQSTELFFDAFWSKCIHDGVFTGKQNEEVQLTYNGNVLEAASTLKESTSVWEVELYVTTALGNGNQADNPWLQELPDPVTKVVWDNYITMNPADMGNTYEIKTAQETPADMATVTVDALTITLPVVAVPGQKIGTIGIALGYGKGTVGDKIIGENAFPFVQIANNNFTYFAAATIEKTGEKYPIASTQTHHTMMGRRIVQETSLGTYQKQDKEVWNETPKLVDALGVKRGPAELDLWEAHPIEKGHRWGMSIDLNACTGCGACVTACHAENNVPVVGKDEVRRTRTMSWLRIDRYYTSDADPKLNNGEKNYGAMEVPSNYPQVVFQPLMCQHCNHAPCETVCPVAATTHSNEGLNQMAYNRCVGTRYCANNCPFKVRRFNWFNYIGDEKFADFNPAQNELARMVLNPDVTVRSRGVMEKCSMCVQRIQAGKLDAKKKGTPVQDNQIQTACSAACNGNAIKFGDLNDESHTVWALSNDERAYVLLDELGVKPNIYYQTKVRNVPTPDYELNHVTKPEHSA